MKLTPIGDLVHVDLRTRPERARELAADMLELTLTFAGTIGICLACLALLIWMGFVP